MTQMDHPKSLEAIANDQTLLLATREMDKKIVRRIHGDKKDIHPRLENLQYILENVSK
jgi:hypothetical protein